MSPLSLKCLIALSNWRVPLCRIRGSNYYRFGISGRNIFGKGRKRYMYEFAARKCDAAVGLMAKLPKAAHCASLCMPALPAATDKSVQAATFMRSAPIARRYKGRLRLESTVLMTWAALVYLQPAVSGDSARGHRGNRTSCCLE